MSAAVFRSLLTNFLLSLSAYGLMNVNQQTHSFRFSKSMIPAVNTYKRTEIVPKPHKIWLKDYNGHHLKYSFV